MWPINSGYGWRTDPFTRRRKFHKGIDIGTPLGAIAQAVAPGTIAHIGQGATGLGNFIQLRTDDGLLVTYGHLSQIDVTRGQRVRALERLGLTGSSGRSTAPHLHLTIQMGRAGRHVDPEPFFKPGVFAS